MKITIPELSLVVLIGPSGSGKSSFARKHFKPTEILSSDYCRGLVSDDENNQAATNDAFEVLHFIAAKRLAAGKLVVVDATNVQPESRKPLVELAREYHCLPVAIVLNLPERLCQDRNTGRADRDFGPHVIRQQSQQLRRSLRGLEREGFRHVFVLNAPEEVDTAIIERQPLWNNKKHEHGPFDIIGDVHGCYGEQPGVDRGPKSPEVRAPVSTLLDRHRHRRTMAQQYVRAYQHYCWPVADIGDLKLAPFHVLATEGKVHVDKSHEWHMETIRRVCEAGRTVDDGYNNLLLATPYRIVDVTDVASQTVGIQWWEELTGAGGEGMVVKPFDFLAKGRRGLAQPAVKCRGREYLRIIYGPEYTASENLERLKSRGLSAKRSLASREFALGIEGLERFVRTEPLRRVHECVFGVLALESEPVDPRL